jgi:hypothetical protein
MYIYIYYILFPDSPIVKKHIYLNALNMTSNYNNEHTINHYNAALPHI